MPNDNELDVALFDWRGVKLTFRLPELKQDENGDIIEDIRFGDDGELSSSRLDRLITYADIIADRIDAERAKGGLARAAAFLPLAPQYTPAPTNAQAAYGNAYQPQGVPQMGQPTGYQAPQVADRVCPKCGGGLLPEKQTSRGPVRECAQQRGQCVNDKGYPTSVWTQQGRR